MINRKIIILMLLCISWPVNNFHRLLNAYPETWGYWYPFNPECKEELQWHIRAIGEDVSYLCIFIAIWLYISSFKRQYSEIKLLFSGILIVQIIDLAHYLGWHRQNEIVLFIEALVFVIISLIILYKKYAHGQTR